MHKQRKRSFLCLCLSNSSEAWIAAVLSTTKHLKVLCCASTKRPNPSDQLKLRHRFGQAQAKLEQWDLVGNRCLQSKQKVISKKPTFHTKYEISTSKSRPNSYQIALQLVGNRHRNASPNRCRNRGPNIAIFYTKYKITRGPTSGISY